MLNVQNVSKYFSVDAINDVNFQLDSGRILGLIGSNGSGKSTLLRLIANVYKVDKGIITVNDMDVNENISYKKELFFASDEPYFLPRSNMEVMERVYKNFYNFDGDIFKKLTSSFGLDVKKPLSNFSKGQKRQALIILAMCTRPKYLLLDEIFDGLDIVMKEILKKIIVEQMTETEMTTIITTHTIAELDNLCDQISLMHNGKLLINKDIEALSEDIVKVQVLLNDPTMQVFNDLNILKHNTTGSMVTLITRDGKAKVQSVMQGINPKYYEILPLTIQDIFLIELEEVGYGTNL